MMAGFPKTQHERYKPGRKCTYNSLSLLDVLFGKEITRPAVN